MHRPIGDLGIGTFTNIATVRCSFLSCFSIAWYAIHYNVLHMHMYIHVHECVYEHVVMVLSAGEWDHAHYPGVEHVSWEASVCSAHCRWRRWSRCDGLVCIDMLTRIVSLYPLPLLLIYYGLVHMYTHVYWISECFSSNRYYSETINIHTCTAVGRQKLSEIHYNRASQSLTKSIYSYIRVFPLPSPFFLPSSPFPCPLSLSHSPHLSVFPPLPLTRAAFRQGSRYLCQVWCHCKLYPLIKVSSTLNNCCKDLLFMVIVFIHLQNLAAERSYNNLDISLKQALLHRAPVSCTHTYKVNRGNFVTRVIPSVFIILATPCTKRNYLVWG